MKRRSIDDPPVKDNETLDMFAPIRWSAHSAPGSETSREAAELVSVDGECLRVLLWFSTQSQPRTRQDVAMAVYPARREGDVPGLGPACGRVNDLITLGYLAQVGREKRRSTLRITPKGNLWLARRGLV